MRSLGMAGQRGVMSAMPLKADGIAAPRKSSVQGPATDSCTAAETQLLDHRPAGARTVLERRPLFNTLPHVRGEDFPSISG